MLVHSTNDYDPLQEIIVGRADFAHIPPVDPSMKNFMSLIPRIFFFLYKIFMILFDPRMPTKVKLFFILSILYVIFPFDIIRDIIPILGQLDDLLVILVAILVYKFQEFKKNIKDNSDEKIIDGEFRNIDSDENWKKMITKFKKDKV